MITPMLRPDLFGLLATHAGDTLYEMCYVPHFAACVRQLRGFGGDIWNWWRDFTTRTSFTREEDRTLLMLLGVSACFSAREDGTVELPFDPVSGALRPEVWQRWRDWDPVRMVPRHADALRSQRAIWIDPGTKDDWFLDLGAPAFRDALLAIGVPLDVIKLELFDAAHVGIDYRYPQWLAWLCQRMAG